jgi:hypothetical protein
MLTLFWESEGPVIEHILERGVAMELQWDAARQDEDGD